MAFQENTKARKIALIFGILFYATTAGLLLFFGVEDFEIINIKIVTYLQITTFLIFAALVHKFRHLLKMKHLDYFIMLAFVLTMLSLFEMLWSFNYWFTTYQIEVNNQSISGDVQSLDKVYYNLNPKSQPAFIADRFNLNSSAKKNTLFLFSNLYLLYSLIDLKYSRKVML